MVLVVLRLVRVVGGRVKAFVVIVSRQFILWRKDDAVCAEIVEKGL